MSEAPHVTPEKANESDRDPRPGATSATTGDGNSSQSLASVLQYVSPRRISALYLAAVFIVLFTLMDPGSFFTATTMTVVFSSGVVTCLLALAFLVPLIAGAYDLAIGAVMTLSLTLPCDLYLKTSIPLPFIVLISLGACALVGLGSGLLVVKFNINSFIATLGMSEVLLALVLLLSNNQELLANFPHSFSNLGNGTLIGIPFPMFALMAISLVIGLYLSSPGGAATYLRSEATRSPHGWLASTPAG